MLNTPLGLLKPEDGDAADLLVFIGQNMDILNTLITALQFDTSGSGATVTYTNGKPTRIVEADGSSTIDLAYNATSGKLETVTESRGGNIKTTTITYNPDGTLASTAVS